MDLRFLIIKFLGGVWVFVSLLLVFSGSTASGVESTDRFPRSWYFKMTAKRVTRIKEMLSAKEFEGLRLPSGLYLQDHQDLWLRPNVAPGQLIGEVRFGLPKYSGYCHAGLVYPRSSPEEPELWLILPTRQRYLLAKKIDGVWRAKRFLPFPESDFHWTPVRGGVLWYNSSWRPFFKKHPSSSQPANTRSGGAEGSPILVTNRQSRKRLQPMISVRFIESKPIPLTLYRSDSNRQLALSCPSEGRPHFRTLSVVECDEMDLILMDLSTGKSEHLAEKVRWPLAISYQGVYSLESKEGQKELHFYEVDWNAGALKREKRLLRILEENEEFVTYGFQFHIKKGNGSNRGTELYTLSPDNRLARRAPKLREFEASTPKEDGYMQVFTSDGVQKQINLLPQITSGARVAMYSNAEVTRNLSQVLGRSRHTLAVVVYKDGQLPDEIVTDFVWKTAVTKSVPISQSLEELDRVYQLTASDFEGLDDEEVMDRFSYLQAAVEQKRSIAYLSGFPAENQRGVTRGGGEQLFADFWSTFKESIVGGDSRIVISMRDDVYADLRSHFPTVFKYAEVLKVPGLTETEVHQLVAGMRRAMERREGRQFTQAGYEQFADFIVSTNFKSDLRSPEREKFAMEKLFDYLNTFHPHSIVIDPPLLAEWFTYRTGGDLFRKILNPDEVCSQLQNDIVSHDEIIEDICVSLKAIKSGNRIYEKGPLAKFIFFGPTGTGKTFIPERVASLIAGSDANINDILIMVDMSEFAGIRKSSPLYQKLKEAENDIRIVVFDDVDQIEKNRLIIDRLAGVMDNGIYGEGSEVELDFSNTIVFWTANWGEGLINKAEVNDQDLVTQIGKLLTRAGKDNEAPILRHRIWGRIESAVYPFRPFTIPQLFELGIVLTKNRLVTFKKQNSKDVRLDPNLIMEIVSQEKNARAGARSIKNRLGDEIFASSAFSESLLNPRVRKIGVLQNQNLSLSPFSVISNLSADFEDFWNDEGLLPDIRAWTEDDDQNFVCRYLDENSGILEKDISKSELNHYQERYCDGAI